MLWEKTNKQTNKKVAAAAKSKQTNKKVAAAATKRIVVKKELL